LKITDEQAKSYDTLGYFVLEKGFDTDTISTLIAEIDPFESELEETLRTEHRGKALIARVDEITFTTHLVARSLVLRQFATHPILLDLCADLIGPDVRLYWDQAVYKKPHTQASFPWHQDNGYAFIEPQQYLTCWIALTDAHEENGCPWVVPGIHKSGTLQHTWTETGLICFEDAADAVPVSIGAGGIVVFSSLTPHCTGPNRTDEVRKSYIVQFAPDGAEVLSGGARGPQNRMTANASDRQFLVLKDGKRVVSTNGRLE
jgi:ectoine hydroxylase-related dioxygenase (phytanoyl-CoA dioxygenase family)